MILVVDAITDDYGKTLELQGEKKGGICRSEMYVQVICRNAAHAVWRDLANTFMVTTRGNRQ